MPTTPTPVRSFASQIMTHGDDPWVGTKLPKRTNLTLPDEPHGTAGQRSLGEDRQRRSLQGSAGRGGCMMIWRLLASVLVVSDQGQRQRQTIKQEQAMNDSKNKADTSRVCRSGD